MKIYNILNLGAGVQSSTVFLMSCFGILPKLDHAIFADTGWEPKEVYTHLEWLIEMGMKHDIPVHVVSRGNIRDDTVAAWKDKTKRVGTMPLFLLNEKGGRGILRRQCTSDYKINPIMTFIKQKILKVRRCAWVKDVLVRQWFGISADEIQRTRISDSKWIQFIYPLLGKPDQFLNKQYTRADCLEWLSRYAPDRKIPRSACIGCPYHSNKKWANIKLNEEQWNDIVEFDKIIRNGSWVKSTCFLHSSRKPITEVDFNKDIDKQGGPNEECSGFCMV